MVQIALTGRIGAQRDVFLEQVLVDVDDSAAGKDFVELVALQLVIAGTATDHHRLDVQVVERVGHTVEQHAVVGDDLVGLVELAAAALRIAAAQIARRQHRLHAGMPEHGLRGQPDLREQALRTAARKVKHRLGFSCGALGVADDRDVVLVFNVQQSAGRLFGQAAGHFLVDEVNHLLFDRRLADAGRRLGRLLAGKGAQQVIGQALGLEADIDHGTAHELDGLRVGRVQEEHGRRIAGPERLLAHLAQQVAHVHRYIAKVDVDRARRQALVADRAVVGHVFKFFPVLDRDAAARLLFVQKSLDQQRGRQDLVARAVEQVGAWHMGSADRLALAAAQAVLDAVGNVANVRLLHDQRLMAHQPEAGGVGVGQVSRKGRVAQQLALVEAALGVHAVFVVGERLQLFSRQEVQLGDADAVLAGDDAIERARQHHDAGHGTVRRLQHVVVVAVDGQVGVHVAVARMHVQRHPDAALEHAAVDGRAFIQDGLESRAIEDGLQRRTKLGFPAGAQRVVLQLRKHRLDLVQPAAPESTNLAHQSQRLRHPIFEQLGRRDLIGVV